MHKPRKTSYAYSMCSFLPTTELCLNVLACSAIHVFCILFVPCTLRYATTVLLSVAVGFEYVTRAEKKKKNQRKNVF